jgi:chromosome partitioning protein
VNTAGDRPHFIVFANEKGGTGKSTTAVHSAVALAAAGRRVAAIDLDTRQRTLGRYLDNRAATIRRLQVDLPMPAHETFDPAKNDEPSAQIDRLCEALTWSWWIHPAATIPFARQAMQRADTLVTPDQRQLRRSRPDRRSRCRDLQGPPPQFLCRARSG